MSDYREVLQTPKASFKSFELQDASVKQTPLGLPSLVSGGFALTACLTTQTNGTKSTWAIRCFHKEVPDLQERYQYISNFLQNKNDDFFVKFKYETEGIKVQGKSYPIVRMAWVEGKSLSEYIQDNLNNYTQLNNLASQVKAISQRLRELKMAHGDIQHGNVLVRNNGSCVLIDYDGMYVPGMPYKNSNEIGHVAFQHPQRNSLFFNEKIDRFSTIIFYVSVLSLVSPSGKNIWQKYHTGENLIFGRKDYQEPYNSSIFSELLQNSQLAPLVTRLQQICRCNIDDVPTLDDFLNPHIDLSLLKIATTLPITAVSTDAIAAFEAKKTLELVEQEGEKITVIGQVINIYFYGDIVFINFGTLKETVNNYDPFTIVIFSKGLGNLHKVKNITLDELKLFKGKYLKITGILELYSNRRGNITPEIVVEDPYQLTVLTYNEANDILKPSTKTTPLPVPKPLYTQPLPPKPVPPPANQPVATQSPSSPPKQPAPSTPSTTKPPQNTRNVSSNPASTTKPPQNTRNVPNNPAPTNSSTTSQNDSCFIATAAYESKNHPDVETFRLFRDKILLKYSVGKYLVVAYYRVGPYLAKLISSYLPLKQFVRTKLEHLAKWIRAKKII
ncbi:CFI-box-CTERM domain-containing protein [Rivularia sp. UHCC 0363]|uniref:CFI-box-CTERM domain-containing protein n=1 Tax=Rivularia sp. UHCC 0363 TaxID=3110244 RepID=UPI002B21D643|nr:CFI-box-CTERM domain-containing protein [Rivularia sp. UHCC 0363]MEA5595735.1 CFI-box-CTERM domain-containing protein [Rivularia sp. UHCC 0363]